jgi:hypothetical protein
MNRFYLTKILKICAGYQIKYAKKHNPHFGFSMDVSLDAFG